VRFITAPDGTHHLIARAKNASRCSTTSAAIRFWSRASRRTGKARSIDREVEARGLRLREQALEALQLLPQAPGELVNAIRGIESIPALADIVASFMDLKAADKQEILATFDLKARLDRVLALLASASRCLKVSRQIDERTREAFDERQKEAVLRERLRQIQKELGETDRVGRARGTEAGDRGCGMPPEAPSRRSASWRASSACRRRPPNIR
jgi:ATP-dependent Lon protease